MNRHLPNNRPNDTDRQLEESYSNSILRLY